MNDNGWLLAVPALVAAITVIWGLFRHVATSVEKVRDDLEPKISGLQTEFHAKCESNYNLHEVKIDALRQTMEQRIERVAASESKARHDMNNIIGGQLIKLEQTVMRIGDQAVRKEDLNAVERTLEALVLKAGNTEILSQRLEDLAKRFDKFMDSQEHRKQGAD